MFKVNRGNLSSTMKGIIEPRTERICSFQSISEFFELLVNTVFHGRESIYTLFRTKGTFFQKLLEILIPQTFSKYRLRSGNLKIIFVCYARSI